MECTKNCFRFLDFQLIDGQPKGGDSTFLQPTVHEREKLLRIEINRTRYFGRGRFSRNDVVLSRTGLEEEATILHNWVHARIPQRIGVIDAGIKISESEDLFRDVHRIHPLDVWSVEKRVGRDTAAVAEKQHVF